MVRSRTSRVIAVFFAVLASAVFLVVAMRSAQGGVRSGSRGEPASEVVPVDVTPSPVPSGSSNPDDFGWQGTAPFPF